MDKRQDDGGRWRPVGFASFVADPRGRPSRISPIENIWDAHGRWFVDTRPGATSDLVAPEIRGRYRLCFTSRQAEVGGEVIRAVPVDFTVE